jgi:hypothetical protein
VAKYKSKLSQEVGQYADLIRSGTLLAIDPSSGSQGSTTGYALFKCGKLVDCGLVDLPRSGHALANRLFLLRQSLMNDFEQPSLLAVEHISPVMPSKGGKFLHSNASSLIKAVGAILSCWDVPVLEPSPVTWHSMTPPEYVKNDCNDACMVGSCVFITLARVLGEPEPRAQLPGDLA